jgi:hypothetical protein
MDTADMQANIPYAGKRGNVRLPGAACRLQSAVRALIAAACTRYVRSADMQPKGGTEIAAIRISFQMILFLSRMSSRARLLLPG